VYVEEAIWYSRQVVVLQLDSWSGDYNPVLQMTRYTGFRPGGLFEHKNETSYSVEDWEFLDHLKEYWRLQDVSHKVITIIIIVIIIVI
jgi:hypothetical protein